jgi:hypothetical protein
LLRLRDFCRFMLLHLEAEWEIHGSAAHHAAIAARSECKRKRPEFDLERHEAARRASS